MKKIFISILFLNTFTVGIFANVNDDKEDHDPTFVITDCGTVHQVDGNLSDEEIAQKLDEYTQADCK